MINNNKEKYVTTVCSEAEMVIDHNLPVCRPLIEVLQHQTLPGIALGLATGCLSCLKIQCNGGLLPDVISLTLLCDSIGEPF